jgi:tetratricopeptide (TPR) repeat protein
MPSDPPEASRRLAGAQSSGSDALTIDQALDRLRAADWPERWRLLATTPFLRRQETADLIARSTAADDQLLTLVVARTAEVGVAQMQTEFPLAARLHEIAPAEPPVETTTGLAAVRSAQAAELAWLAPLLIAAIRRLAADAEEPARAELKRLALSHLAAAADVGDDALKTVELLIALPTWPEVWAELAGLSDRETLTRTARIWAECADWFGETEEHGEADTLAELLTAITTRGLIAAIHEHQMMLTVAELLSGSSDDQERSAKLAAQATRMATYSQTIGATWLLPAALTAARSAAQHTKPEHPAYPGYASGLGNRIAETVQAGLLNKDSYTEALHWQRQAVEHTRPGHPNYPAYASNLGNRIAQAIQAGLLDQSAYTEAIHWQRQAVEHTNPEHRSYPMYASNLGNRIAHATEAGLLDKDSYTEALHWHRQAVEHTKPEHPDFSTYASNLGSLIALAVQADLLDQSAYTEALRWLRQAVEHSNPKHPDYPRYASNLGTLIAITNRLNSPSQRFTSSSAKTAAKPPPMKSSNT